MNGIISLKFSQCNRSASKNKSIHTFLLPDSDKILTKIFKVDYNGFKMSENPLPASVTGVVEEPTINDSGTNPEVPQQRISYEQVFPTPVSEGIAVESVGGETPAMVIKFAPGQGEVDVFRGKGEHSNRHLVRVRRGPVSITLMDGHRPPMDSEYGKIRSQVVEVHGEPDQLRSITAFGNLLSVDATQLSPDTPITARMGAAVYRPTKTDTKT